ncbi:MAG: septum formation initiator family protein [Bacteroidetes bacterium]|nr:septum formation initiator family protein [Rhodothermia bacterium]MCS7155862.1 septum formation initiator family protein [Bacteroidota bacterium]MCX7906037.1 septum formation initiator family protein [Bacteroidota bacterium]MDW8138165.1 septum formation initiator family protein [Bacteroidota bacterium]MDW8285849.1 septum formation initiator family protein [Bacteroidota bacterium]
MNLEVRAMAGDMGPTPRRVARRFGARRRSRVYRTWAVERLPNRTVLGLLLGFFAAGLLYVWHVLQIQALADEVARLRREHESLQAQKAQYEHEYYRLTSPSRIYEAAQALGLVEGLTYRQLYVEP